MPNGEYTYTCTSPLGYNSTEASGDLTIADKNEVIPVYFSKVDNGDFWTAIKLEFPSGAPVVGAMCRSDEWGYTFSGTSGLCNFTTATPSTTTTIILTGIQGHASIEFGLTTGDLYGLCFDGETYYYCPVTNRTTDVCDSFSGGYTYVYTIYDGGLKRMNFFTGTGTIADFKNNAVKGSELCVDEGDYLGTTTASGFEQIEIVYDFLLHQVCTYHPDYQNSTSNFYTAIDDDVYMRLTQLGEDVRKEPDEPGVMDYTGLFTLALSGDGIGLGISTMGGIATGVIAGPVMGLIVFAVGIAFFSIGGIINPVWGFLLALLAALGVAMYVGKGLIPGGG